MHASTHRAAAVLAALFALALVAVPAAAGADGEATRPDHRPDAQGAALDRLRESSARPVVARFAKGFPYGVRLDVAAAGDGAVGRAQSFLREYGDLYGQTSPNLTLDVERAHDDVVVFQQRYRGVLVEGGQLVVHLSGDRVVGTVGALLKEEAVVDPQPQLLESQAQERAEAALRRRSAPLQGPATLVVFDEGLLDEAARHRPRLAWRLALGGGTPTLAFVDAHDGVLLSSVRLEQDAFDLEIHDANNTHSGQTPKCYGFGLFSDYLGNQGGLKPGVLDPDASAALSFSKGVYDFYAGHFNLNSYNGWGAEIRMYVNSSTPGTARWVPSCDLFEFNTGAVVKDIVAHEITHAVITHSSNLMYKNQSGALNESFADVFGALFDGNWTVAESTPGGAFRSLADPPSFQSSLDDVGVVAHPDRNTNYVSTTDDSGGVHVNSGIPNKAAYLLGAGDKHNGFWIKTIGQPRLRQLAYKTMTSLPNWAGFGQAAWTAYVTADSWAASGSHGFTSWDACQVLNAYAAVEMNNDADADCDGVFNAGEADNDNDTIADGPDNCNNISNPGQADTDGDGIGDACDDDLDGDGDENAADNCVSVPNPSQADSDNDGQGNACEDDDGDKVFDGADNCDDEWNPGQSDLDGDGLGDVCDPDADGDGITWDDNCPLTPNPDQADSDNGGIGDACDPLPNDPLNDLIAKLKAQRLRVDPTTSYNKILIEICAVDGCWDWLRDPSIYEVILDGLEPATVPVLFDAQGRRVPATLLERDGATVLQFRAVPGQQLALELDGQLSSFTIAVTQAEAASSG